MLLACLRIGLLLTTFVLSLSVAAEQRLWYLAGVQFSDGASATGYFSYDDVTHTVADWNVHVTQGSSFAEFTYVPDNSEVYLWSSIMFWANLGAGEAPPDFRRVLELYLPLSALDGSNAVVPLASAWSYDGFSNGWDAAWGRGVVAGSLAISPTIPDGWVLEEVYSNADGTVQFAVFSTAEGGQEHLTGFDLITTGPARRSRRSPTFTHAFKFSHDLPADSANRSFLVATQGFADLQVQEPDFVVPNGFLPTLGGTISIAGAGYDIGALPTDGVHALQLQEPVGGNPPAWGIGTAVATNFAGQQYSFAPPQPAPQPSLLSLTLNPTSVVAGALSTGTIGLSGPAPSGGAVVYLQSSARAVGVPTSVLVPTGQTSVSFTVMTRSIPRTMLQATISATFGDTSASALITITR